ncbi:putative DNA helicase [Vibrio phage 82E33.2]|nr:putative DNA helicase [Vibrio phage 82E33.2]
MNENFDPSLIPLEAYEEFDSRNANWGDMPTDSIEDAQVSEPKPMLDFDRLAKDLAPATIPLADIPVKADPATLNPQQLEAFEDMKAGKNVFLTGEGGCVDADTEFLTPKGWVKISNYKDGDLVAQWSESGEISFIKPLGYTKVPAKTLTEIETKTVKMSLSLGHRTPYLTSRGNLSVKSFGDALKMSKLDIPRGFNFKLGDGTGISKELIRVLIMQSADGSDISTSLGFKVAVNVKKERKKERARHILSAAGIPFKEWKSSGGYVRFAYYPPLEIATKGLAMLWDCTPEEISVAASEIPLWDGSVNKSSCGIERVRFTGSKSDCDVVQFILSSHTGCYHNLRKDCRDKYKSDVYDVSSSSRDVSHIELNNQSGCGSQTKIVDTVDGFQYCFTTETTFWLARKDGFIFPTGNTGKSYVTECFIQWCLGMKLKVVVSAPTGVAAININGVTNHRVFGLPIDYIEHPSYHHSTDKVKELISAADIFIMDEVGMIRCDQFTIIEDRISKFADYKEGDPQNKVGTKPWGGKQIVVVGDFFQLQPVVKDKAHQNQREFTRILHRDYGGIFAFQSKAWEIADFKAHVLMKSERHKNGDDSAIYMDALNSVRVGRTDKLHVFNYRCSNKMEKDQDNTTITFTNAMADQINEKRLAGLRGSAEVINDIVDGKAGIGDRVAPMVLQLKIGAKVTTLVNNPEKGYANGTVGIVTNICLSPFPDDEDCITIKREDGQEIYVKRHAWEIHDMEGKDGAPTKVKIGEIKQFPLRLAWAITAHKSQGKTLESAILMMDGKMRTHGQTYVALSRVKSIDGITLFSQISPRDIVCDPIVQWFYSSLTGQKMVVEYDPHMHKLIAGITELEKLCPPDGCLDWINERILYAITEMNQRRMSGN